jgi:rRNA-processing protein FCF1
MKRGRRRHDTVFVDTNLFLVLLVGGLDVDQIERFKRTKAYTREDYALLVMFVNRFKRILVTPNVLTEVSNLAGQLTDPLRREARFALACMTQDLHERYLPSKELVVDPHFPTLGLTDVSIVQSVGKDVTVITADLPLYHRLATAGVDAINFNHLRSGSWM